MEMFLLMVRPKGRKEGKEGEKKEKKEKGTF
jgi:hypothetical protein